MRKCKKDKETKALMKKVGGTQTVAEFERHTEVDCLMSQPGASCGHPWCLLFIGKVIWELIFAANDSNIY